MNTASIAERELETESEVDAIEEIRLRTWARKNYAPAADRDESWHPIIIDEMEQKDREN